MREIPFDVLDMKYLLLIMLMLVLLLAGGTMLHIAKKMKSQNAHIETDEMFKKIGYTALAASFKILMGIVLLTGLLDKHLHFLKELSPYDVLHLIWILGLILVPLTSRWYSHHPDKT